MTKLSQTKTGVWYIQYRIPGVHSPQKESFGRGESAMKSAEVRIEEIKSGYVYTSKVISSRRRLYLDELSQCYLDMLRSKGKTEQWSRNIKYVLNEHFLPNLCHIPVNDLTMLEIFRVAERFNNKAQATKNRYLDILKALCLKDSPLAKILRVLYNCLSIDNPTQ